MPVPLSVESMTASPRELLDRASIFGSVDRTAYDEREAALWKQLRERGRSLDMFPIGVTTKAHLDLDKVSGRFLAAGASALLLHDVSSFMDYERTDDVMAQVEIPGRNPLVTGLNWYPHDTGMLTASLASGTLVAWDTAHLQVIELLDAKTSIACHAISHLTLHSTVALGTSSGLELFDLTQGKRQLLLRSSSRVKALAWDVHRSGLIFTGSSSGQLCQWDLRQPQTPLFMVQAPHPIDRMKVLPGYEGNLPAVLLTDARRVTLWSLFDGLLTQISPDKRNAVSFDHIAGLDVLVLGLDSQAGPELVVDGTTIAMVPGLVDIVANPFAREVYVYERAHEKLRCFAL